MARYNYLQPKAIHLIVNTLYLLQWREVPRRQTSKELVIHAKAPTVINYLIVDRVGKAEKMSKTII